MGHLNGTAKKNISLIRSKHHLTRSPVFFFFLKWWIKCSGHYYYYRARALMVRGPYWNRSVSSSSPKWITFWGPKHARKTHETLHTCQKWQTFTSDNVFRSGWTKWLNNTTYKISTKCPSSYVSHICTKFGSRNPTGSLLFRIFSASFVPFLPFPVIVFKQTPPSDLNP